MMKRVKIRRIPGVATKVEKGKRKRREKKRKKEMKKGEGKRKGFCITVARFVNSKSPR
jgi:hypothetical protein